MSTIATDRVAKWRAEIEEELQQNSEQLARLRPELEEAETAHAEAVSSWMELRRFVERPLGLSIATMLDTEVYVSEGLAPALYSRLQDARDEIRKAEGPRGKARAYLKHLEERRAALLHALNQAERILTADDRVIDKSRSSHAVDSPKTPKQIGPGGSVLPARPAVAFDEIEMPAS